MDSGACRRRHGGELAVERGTNEEVPGAQPAQHTRRHADAGAARGCFPETTARRPPGSAARRDHAAPRAPSGQQQGTILGGATDACLVRCCDTLTGRHRCADAHLVVVPDLAFLHNVDALSGSVDLAVSFFYIVSLGLDVVTTTHLVQAGGRPDRIPLEHRMRHEPAHLCKQRLYLATGLVLQHPEVRAAALRVARRADSELGVSEGPPRPLAGRASRLSVTLSRGRPLPGK